MSNHQRQKMVQSPSMKNRVALVTGSSHGIGASGGYFGEDRQPMPW